jgi:hypothetical protein
MEIVRRKKVVFAPVRTLTISSLRFQLSQADAKDVSGTTDDTVHLQMRR